jgi:PAS domain-containing protein
MSDTDIESRCCLTNTELNRQIVSLEETLLEKERAGAALRDSEKRYRRLFESAKEGILILDADTGKVVDVNPFLLQLRRIFLRRIMRETYLGLRCIQRHRRVEGRFQGPAK